jgi:hypothetical protein
LGPDQQEFVDLMTGTTALQSVQVKREKKTLYTWGPATIFEVAASLLPRAYLSHYTALYLHGLSEQISNQIFVNQEQSSKAPSLLLLTQGDMDASFARPQVGSTASCCLMASTPVNLELQSRAFLPRARSR